MVDEIQFINSDRGGFSSDLSHILLLIIIVGSFFAFGIFLSQSITQPTDEIGIITIDDMIDSFEYARLMNDALDDPDVKAVVVRIGSPGGYIPSVFQTETSLSNLSQHKPVIANLEEIAASGAYIVASAADHIYTYEQTITGSFAVSTIWVSYEKYFEDQGIEYFVWQSGDRKDLFQPWRSPTENEYYEIESIIEELSDEVFNRIISNRFEKAGYGRGEFKEHINPLRDGDTIDGIEAIYYGLVDELGSHKDAIRKAAYMAGLEESEYKVTNLN